MPENNKHIPVNVMDDDFDQGISIDRISINISDFRSAQQHEQAAQSHRDEGHTFHIVNEGNIIMEIDFQQYRIAAHSVVYMHPDQVHRILDFKNITVSSLSIRSENLNTEYIKLLEEIAPAKPLALAQQAYSIVSDTFSLCLSFSAQGRNRLYFPLLRDSCNSLVALLLSQLLNQSKKEGNLSRFEIITKSFKQLLQKNFRTLKRPSDYARGLNISTSYLNECVNHVTGHSVSIHIRNRIVLEAKRLLYHTDKSAKEIAFDLGYEDYPYFSRLFTKTAGISAMAFRNKNRE